MATAIAALASSALAAAAADATAGASASSAGTGAGGNAGTRDGTEGGTAAPPAAASAAAPSPLTREVLRRELRRELDAHRKQVREELRAQLRQALDERWPAQGALAGLNGPPPALLPLRSADRIPTVASRQQSDLIEEEALLHGGLSPVGRGSPAAAAEASVPILQSQSMGSAAIQEMHVAPPLLLSGQGSDGQSDIGDSEEEEDCSDDDGESSVCDQQGWKDGYTWTKRHMKHAAVTEWEKEMEGEMVEGSKVKDAFSAVVRQLSRRGVNSRIAPATVNEAEQATSPVGIGLDRQGTGGEVLPVVPQPEAEEQLLREQSRNSTRLRTAVQKLLKKASQASQGQGSAEELPGSLPDLPVAPSEEPKKPRPPADMPPAIDEPGGASSLKEVWDSSGHGINPKELGNADGTPAPPRQSNSRRPAEEQSLATDSSGKLLRPLQLNKGSSGSAEDIAEKISRCQSSGPRPAWRVLLEAMVYSWVFEYFFFVLIIINAVTIGVQTDMMARHLTLQTHWAFHVLENAFCVFFTLEVALRVIVDRHRFFSGSGWGLNAFDITLVIMQLMDVTLGLLASHGSAISVNFYSLRVIRLIRLVRIVRTLRLLRMIGDVRALVWSVAASIKPLFGALLILFLLIYIVAIYLTDVAMMHRVKAGPDEESFHAMGRYYGTLDRSILSLFESITGGLDWDDVVDPLIRNVGPLTGVGFSLFIAFCLLALMNVVTGVFVETALRQSKQDKDNYTVSHLKTLFAEMDSERTGMITLQDFKERLETTDMLELFKSLDLDVSEVDGVFRILDFNDEGSIDQDAFLSGCLRLRGPAKALDVLVLMRETDRMFQKCFTMMTSIEKQTRTRGRKRQPVT